MHHFMVPRVVLAKEKIFKASVKEIIKKVTNKTKIVFISQSK